MRDAPPPSTGRRAKLGDLSIEEPTKFERVINLETGKTLGLTSPRRSLSRQIK